MGAIASQITSLTIVYSIVYSDADQRKHQSSAALAFVRGIHRGPVNSPNKWPVARKMFPFDDVIMTYGKPSHESMLTWTKFRVILIKIQTVSFKKMRLKKSSAKRPPFYSDFTSLKGNLVVRHGFPDRQVQMVYLCGNLASISRTIYEQTYIQTLQKYMLLWHER